MDFKRLATFEKISELKSFSKAAEELYITQPTVSKQIMDLEDHFKIRLLDRTKRSVTLTRAGEILLKYAHDLLSLKKEMTEAMDAFKGLKTGTINVGASSIPGVYILPRVLKEFKNEYDGIQIKLTISDSKTVLEGMENGSFDIGFVGGREKMESLDFIKFLEDTILIAASGDFPDRMTIEEFARSPLIMREPGSATRRTFEAELKRLIRDGIKDINIVAEMSDAGAVKEAVSQGMGLSCLSGMAIEKEVRNGEMKIIAIEGLKEMKRSFYVTIKRGRTMLPHARALIDIAKEWRQRYEKV